MALTLLRRRPTVGASVDLGTAFVRVGTPCDPVVVERTTRLRGDGPAAMARGVVNDIGAAGEVLSAALHEATVPVGRRSRLVISIPATANQVERTGLLRAVSAAGVRREPILVEEPIAAAIGLGLDIADVTPHLVVDVGHGITEAAIISDGAIRTIGSDRVGCGLIWATVERIRREEAIPAVVSARDLLARAFDPTLADTPRSRRVRAAVTPILDRFAGTVHSVLDQVPLDVAASVTELHLVGGGSLLPCVVAHLSTASGLEVRLATDRLYAVAKGDLVCASEAFRRSGWA
jgi:rod shape-determining protein MreB